MISDYKKNKIYESNKNIQAIFIPKDIEPKDDGFHESKAIMCTEWWYFDAEFDNKYSIQMNLRINSAFKRIVKIFLRLEIYKEGKLIKSSAEVISKKRFRALKDQPIVFIDDKEIIKGALNKKTGNYVFELNLDFNNISAKLKFDGCTKGWKGIVPIGSWAVILPKAYVTGVLKINNESVNVKGHGYHDHNWDFTPSKVLNFGWFWGKIMSKNHTIAWATIFKNEKKGAPLLVINKDNGGYTNILPKNIYFVARDFKKDNKRDIPNFFQLKVDDEKVKIDVSMQILDTRFIKIMRLFNYWRYHARCTGYILIDGEMEKINQIHMLEFIRFK